VVKAGAAAHRAAQSKTDKYASLASTHIFCPFAIETAGAWHETAIEVMQEIGRRITVVTEDTSRDVKRASINRCLNLKAMIDFGSR